MTIRKIVGALLLSAVLLGTLSGCYYNNKSWDDLSFAEKQEVRQELSETIAELEEDDETGVLMSRILRSMKNAIEGN